MISSTTNLLFVEAALILAALDNDNVPIEKDLYVYIEVLNTETNKLEKRLVLL